MDSKRKSFFDRNKKSKHNKKIKKIKKAIDVVHVTLYYKYVSWWGNKKSPLVSVPPAD